MTRGYSSATVTAMYGNDLSSRSRLDARDPLDQLADSKTGIAACEVRAHTRTK